ncbi:hypothetical protein MKK52_12490 [Methylobacterium sp. J-067]|nr:hypothetical protein [Methylobacterium sp. J-067]
MSDITNPTVIAGLKFDLECEHTGADESGLAADLELVLEAVKASDREPGPKLQKLYEEKVAMDPRFLAARYLDLLVKIVEASHRKEFSDHRA